MHSRKVYFGEDIKISGLTLMGYNKSNRVQMPMTMHVHENCMEVVVLIKGSECYLVSENKIEKIESISQKEDEVMPMPFDPSSQNGEQGQKFQIKGGQAFVSFLNEPHKNGNDLQGISEFIWFQLNLIGQKNFLGLEDRTSDLIIGKLANMQDHVFDVDKKGIFLLKEVLRAIENREWIYAQGLFVSFLYKLLYLHPKSVSENNPVIKAMAYINDNINETLSMEALSEFCNVSLSTLKHDFKSYAGMTPRDYINTCKIDKAKELLSLGWSVTDTAMALSFNTSDYFSVVFKKYALVTPTEYKKKFSSSIVRLPEAAGVPPSSIFEGS